jgi:hypothetical protein
MMPLGVEINSALMPCRVDRTESDEAAGQVGWRKTARLGQAAIQTYSCDAVKTPHVSPGASRQFRGEPPRRYRGQTCS